jgi:hypothetical protein
MKPLHTKKDFEKAKADSDLACKCYQCNEKFVVKKKFITYELKHKIKSVMFCSKSCAAIYKSPRQTVICGNCNISFKKFLNQINKTKNHFCSCSCAVTYNNKNKKTGNRRSKLEIWLEEQLTTLYPNIEIQYNQKSVINSELDIYIPSLNLAFELNGIFHYEPIYGSNKLKQIQENDISKSKSCHEAKIDLCLIDTSNQKYFKECTSTKYLNIITNIIDKRS